MFLWIPCLRSLTIVPKDFFLILLIGNNRTSSRHQLLALAPQRLFKPPSTFSFYRPSLATTLTSDTFDDSNDGISKSLQFKYFCRAPEEYLRFLKKQIFKPKGSGLGIESGHSQRGMNFKLCCSSKIVGE